MHGILSLPSSCIIWSWSRCQKKNNNSDTAKSTNKRYLHVVDNPYGTQLRDTTLAYVGIFKGMCLSGSATKT